MRERLYLIVLSHVDVKRIPYLIVLSHVGVKRDIFDLGNGHPITTLDRPW